MALKRKVAALKRQLKRVQQSTSADVEMSDDLEGDGPADPVKYVLNLSSLLRSCTIWQAVGCGVVYDPYVVVQLNRITRRFSAVKKKAALKAKEVQMIQKKLATTQSQFEKATGTGGAKAKELLAAKEELPKLKDDVAKAKQAIVDRQDEVKQLIKKVCVMCVCFRSYCHCSTLTW